MQIPLFRERVTPNAASYLLPLLAGLGFTAVFLPLIAEMAILVGFVALGTVLGLQIGLSPVIVLTATHLYVGKARIERSHLGGAEVLSGSAKRNALGVELDARSYMKIQGSAPQVLRVEILDSEDPAPYWIFSTRRGAEILAALA